MAKYVPLVVQGIIISGDGPSRNATRQAHFLLPRAERGHLPAPPPPPCDVRPVLPAELRVEFKGWPVVPELWKVWVGKLRVLHEPLWRELGIFHGILATTYSVAERDDATLFQLAAFWSGDDTNTFVFPWGEATVTLEDVAVLAGLPLLGDPVCKRLYGGDRGDVGVLEAVRASLCRSSWTSRPSHAAWAKHFSELPPEDEVLEHEGFLAMWLSLFVLPAPPADEVRPEVFPVAARLARGGAVALAPAALASIYADLSALRRHIVAISSSSAETPAAAPFEAWAPLHVLQLWAWERFLELRPETAARPTPPRDVPRAVRRWQGARSRAPDGTYAHAVLMSPAEFEWAPYGSSGLAPPPGSYGRREIARRGELRSFAHCLRACELVGVGGCVEQYCPHRVARQLGYDQDVPGGGVARASSDWFGAWAKYKIGLVKFSFVVTGDEATAATAEYEQWWEPCSRACAAAVAEAARVKDAALPQIAGNVNDIMPGWVRSGAKRTTLRRGNKVSQDSPSAAAILMSAVAEPASASVAEKEPSKSLQQQSEEDAPQLVTTTPGEQNTIPEQAQVQAHRLVQQTQPGATGSSLLNSSEERKPVSTGNCEQGNIVLQAAVAEATGTKVAALSQITGNVNDLMPGWVRSGAKRTALRKGKKVSQGSSGAAAILMSAVGEPASASFAKKEPSKSLQQQSEEITPHPVTMPDEQNCIPEQAEALAHRPVRQTQFGTTTSSLLNPIGERQPVSTGNSEQGNTVLQADRVQNSWVSELAAALENLNLQRGPADSVAAVRTNAGLLLGPTQETRTCAATGEMGTSTQQMESLVKYLVEANENRSGNGEISSGNPVLGNCGTSFSRQGGENTAAPDSTEVCTKTIYYLSRFDRTEEAWAKDANQDSILPKRAVGTMEMIEKASAIRQAECAELMKKILKLAEEIREIEAAEEQ